MILLYSFDREGNGESKWRNNLLNVLWPINDGNGILFSSLVSFISFLLLPLPILLLLCSPLPTNPLETGFICVVQASHKFIISLPLFHLCWDYRPVPTSLRGPWFQTQLLSETSLPSGMSGLLSSADEWNNNRLLCDWYSAGWVFYVHQLFSVLFMVS